MVRTSRTMERRKMQKNIKFLGSWSLDRGGVSTYCLLDPLVVFELASFGCELAGGGGGGIGVPWPPSIPNPVASLKTCRHATIGGNRQTSLRPSTRLCNELAKA